MTRTSAKDLAQRTAQAATPAWHGIRLYTIGHSTRSIDELVALLRAADVSTLADIRTIPRSRHNPQFEREALSAALRRRRLRYVHVPLLGGLRRARPDSPNTAWRNASFRGFADYMLSADFEAGLAELRRLASDGTVAVMCAEAVPWRCHRSLVADALLVRGARVEHITGAGRASPHRLTAFAHVEGTRITYPGEGGTPVASPLATRPPFHLEATVRVLQRRSTNLVDVWESDRYRRVLPTRDGQVLVEVTNRGSIDAPDVRYVVLAGTPGAAALAEVERAVRRVLGLDVDPEPLQRLIERQHDLEDTAVGLRGMRPPRFAGLFEAIVNVIPFQQVSLDAGVAIVSRLAARFGATLERDEHRYFAVPEAGVIATARLDAVRRCGLSRSKAESLRGLARAIASGALTEDRLAAMTSAEAISCLSQYKGIGRWSASLILLRGLGRLDVFPPGDVGVARGLHELLHLRVGAALDRVIERFGDRRGYLYFCSLGASLLTQGLIAPAPLAVR
jgi:3-methyladenine DNA glycosylase/8-oxoguanine DNA glycosylase